MARCWKNYAVPDTALTTMLFRTKDDSLFPADEIIVVDEKPENKIYVVLADEASVKWLITSCWVWEEVG